MTASDLEGKQESGHRQVIEIQKKASREKTPPSRFGNVSDAEKSVMSKGYVSLNTEQFGPCKFFTSGQVLETKV